jgi:hypothetical protein
MTFFRREHETGANVVVGELPDLVAANAMLTALL